MSRGRDVVMLTAVLSVLTGIVMPPLAARLSPGLAVAVAGSEARSIAGSSIIARGRTTAKARTNARDPWGSALIVIPRRGQSWRQWTMYSPGPNKIDEDGGGDDVLPTPFERDLGRRFAAGPVGLYALAALLIWLVYGPYVRENRSESVPTECLRALALASAATLLLPWIGAALLLGDTLPVSELAPLVPFGLVDPVVWILGGSALVCFSVATAWRLSRPLDGTGQAMESPTPGTPT